MAWTNRRGIVPGLLGACGLLGLLVAGVGCRSTLQLAGGLKPFSRVLRGRDRDFSLHIAARLPIGSREQTIDVRLARHGTHAFLLVADHKDYRLRVARDWDRTILELPKHKVAFVGEGPPPASDSLAPEGFRERLLSPDSTVRTYVAHAARRGPLLTAAKLTALGKMRCGEDGAWRTPLLEDVTIKFRARPSAMTVGLQKGDVEVEHSSGREDGFAAAVTPGYRTVQVDRPELERLLLRGWRRMLEVLAPVHETPAPGPAMSVPHGRLRWHDGQRLVLLEGTPAQIGEAHGRLLRREVIKCLDSTLYLMGFVDTVRSGTWFPDRLREAFARLKPHIPDDHLAETDALADAVGVPREEAHLASVFPELFHCSGFALFGKATAGGTLYHGRVLDYMTKVGLQDSAVTFVVAPQGKIPFANIGYAGIIGSATGMNARQIGLGEMGGGRSGDWDGVPMTTVMRRALEECETLDAVKTLWRESPRTCEYYYVFSDSKIPDAVGVEAVPESITFIPAGAYHEKLGEGMEDAVVLSSGSRLKLLRERVQELHGKIDAQAAIRLMDRPVAMSSNLHNALFAPGEGRFFVAHASHKQVAAKRPYVEYDFTEILREFPLDP